MGISSGLDIIDHSYHYHADCLEEKTMKAIKITYKVGDEIKHYGFAIPNSMSQVKAVKLFTNRNPNVEVIESNIVPLLDLM